MNATISTLINGIPTDAVLDTAAMVTLIRDDYLQPITDPDQIGPVCVLTGIGADPVHGRIVYNVPITVGTQTFLHTVCFAPVKDACLLGLDFLRATASVLDLGNNKLTIGPDIIPVNVSEAADHTFSKVTVVRRTVLQPGSVSFVKAELDKPFEDTFIVEGCPTKHTLSSRVYGNGKFVTLKIVNDSEFFVTLKKGKVIGHAEPAVQVPVPEQARISKVSSHAQRSGEQNGARGCSIPAHLQQMLSENTSGLTETQKSKFQNLILEFSDIFSKDDFDLGCLSGVEHSIKTHDEIPIAEKFRRTPLQFQKQEQEYIEQLLKQGVIEPSVSEWSAAPVLVRKKTGELRYCIDYRALNAKTYKDNYSLPLIEDCLDSLYGQKMFCVLDLCAGYFQIPLNSNSKHKTSFSTRFGSFQWSRLPMGLCTAPAIFQRAMQMVLRGLQWEEVIVYLDDVIVLGTDFENTLSSLRKVFVRFREHNLKLKPRKCSFFKEEVEFLGKLVSGSGVSISPDKLQAVEQWPTPSNAKELLSFLGFMNYHRNHIKDFAKVSADLYALVHADLFIWTSRHQACFETLKQLAISAPMLSHPSPDGLFILDTDASGTQIGAALSQVQNGEIKPICFASHVLLKQHRNYCTTRKELLAIIKFCRQFRHFLLGRFFYIRTDHNSLVWLTRFKHLEGQLARFLEELSQYDFKIIHRKGTEHINADALSRLKDPFVECDCYTAGQNVSDLPCGGCNYCRRAHRQWARFNDDVDDIVPLAVRSIEVEVQDIDSSGAQTISNWMEGLSRLELREAQTQDPNIGLVMNWLEHSYEPTTRELQLTGPETRSLWLTRDQLKLQQGILYYSWSNCDYRSDCLVVPAELRPRVLYYCHDSKGSGHLGQDKTLDKLKQRFYWYGMSRDSDIYVKQCSTCNKNKKGNRKPRGALGLYHSGCPMERVHLDIVGPINPRSKSGSAYILVMVDQFTKWVELAALPAQNAELTARAFLRHFIVTFGCPFEVHTDQGRNFESDLFQAFCKVLEITKTRTTPYHASGNGQVEVFNRVILQMIRSYVSRGKKDWDEHLPLISMALHSMKNKSTGFSANMMMLGREVCQPIDLILGLTRSTPRDPPTWVANLLSNLSDIHKLARERIGEAQLRQKRDYDLRLFERSYKLGDVVYLVDSSNEIGVSRKLRPPWTGPFLIVGARPPVYTIEGRRRVHSVHHDRLKPCHDAYFPLWLRRKRHEILDTQTSVPIVEEEDHDMEPDELVQDDSQGDEPFDPDQTLPYMLGDDPDLTLPYVFGDESISLPDSDSAGDIESQQSNSIGGSNSLSDGVIVTQPLGITQTTRTGRKIQLPARFRD